MSEERQAAGRTCPACEQTYLEKNAVFCPYCGVAISEYAGSDGPVSDDSLATGTVRMSFTLCPYCDELINAEATVCKHCGRELVTEENQYSAVFRQSIHEGGRTVSEERQAAGRTCPKCGERILSKHKVFCPNCGVNMPQYAASPRPAPRTPIYTDEQGNRLKKCPFCAEEIKAEAIVCKHCGRDLNAKESQFNATPGGALLMAIAGFLFLLGLGAPRVWGETLPWAGFCIAEILALVILAAAVAQGKF